MTKKNTPTESSHPVLPDDATVSQTVRFVSQLLIELADVVDGTQGLDLEPRVDRIEAVLDGWSARYGAGMLINALRVFADALKPLALSLVARALMEKAEADEDDAADVIAAALG